MPAPAKTQSVLDQLQGKPLSEREHQDPDKHWIGESIAIPTQTEIAATVGSVSGPGDSPYVARADHFHKLGPGVVGNANLADNSVTTQKIQDGTITASDLGATVWTQSSDITMLNNFTFNNGSLKIDMVISRCFLGVYLTYTAATALTPPFNCCSCGPSFRPTSTIRGMGIIQPDSNVRISTIQLNTSGVFSVLAIAGGGTVPQNAGLFIQMHWSLL